MSRIITLIAAALVLTGTLAGPARAQSYDSCGGGCPKLPSNSRAVGADLVSLATFPGNTLSAELAKGKKKTILRADAMLSDGPGGVRAFSREFALGISVNGLAMRPSGSGAGGTEAIEDCGVLRSDPDAKCTITGHWWLDMDDPANAALLGVPITITLVGGDPYGAGVGDPVDMSLDVRLDKK